MKILVVRIGRIGDMVMCTPALSAILDNYPNAELTLITSNEGKALLKCFNNRLNHFIIYNRKSLFQALIKKTLQKKIAKENFDIIYCFEAKSSFYDLFKTSTAKVYGVGEYTSIIPYPQKLLDTVSRGVGRNIGFFPLFLPVEDKIFKEVNNNLADLNITKNTILIGLHPTCSGITTWLRRKKFRKIKLWPIKRYADLAIKIKKYSLQNNIDLKVVTCLLPEEKEIGKEISKLSGGAVVPLTSQFGLNHYIAFLKRVNLFVTPDTGPMHMAAAVQTPLVVLFSGHDPKDCGPFGNADKFKILHSDHTDHPELGIDALEVEMVYSACIEQLECLLQNKA